MRQASFTVGRALPAILRQRHAVSKVDISRNRGRPHDTGYAHDHIQRATIGELISESTGTFLRHINVLDKPADPSAATVTDFTAQGLGPAFRPSADGNSVTSEKGALCILSGAQHEPLDEMTSRTYPVPFVAKSTLVEKGSISDVPQVESHVVAQAFDDDPTTFFTH
ncbi:uncharacterized protein CLUP02_03960 [Colletotrichum lupini]|uniref:Uncharacterized protein n=1 Tax=Colletotrichum lupini TaxID=145971 RepID=A0A9Q8SJV2_9PEZI|nr:uncharacterized protein CLUP02_03960 [Colletotrichum lupini]UQC78483.1 hypothetical protein CLUP02_03960 [Colletotrichum lupini]